MHIESLHHLRSDDHYKLEAITDQLISPSETQNIPDAQFAKKTNYRWIICSMLFISTFLIYFDRQIISLNWTEYMGPEFGWTNSDYSSITSAFTIVYALSMFFAGKVVDKLGTKRGFILALSIWAFGAIFQTLMGIILCRIFTGEWILSYLKSRDKLINGNITDSERKHLTSTSVIFFIVVFSVMAVGESGNFPVSIKAIGEYFPKKDRALATSIFNSGSTVGALAAPLCVTPMTKAFGWESSFLLIVILSIIWIISWIIIYKFPNENHRMNEQELDYINEDTKDELPSSSISFFKCLTFRQTWAFSLGKLLTDGAWWFYLFWTPHYLEKVYKLKNSDISMRIFVIYLLTMISLAGGYLPKYFVEKKKMEPYLGRMKAMLIFAFFPLSIISAQFLGMISPWISVIIIGIACAGHQSWSANIFSTVGDMFPKNAMATVTGIGGMAGGIGSFALQKISGVLFDYAERANLNVLSFNGEEAGYFILFIYCGVAYLIAWCIMKFLVPVYSPVFA